MEELYHVIPGRIIEDIYCYWGPEHGRFLTDSNSIPSYDQQVDILWREGNFYYIKYLDSGANAYKRMCYPCDCIEVIGAITPVLHTPPAVPGCFRSITGNTSVFNILASDNPGKYTSQNNIPTVGSLGYKETVRYLGLTIDGYALVEYDIIDYDMVDDDDDDIIENNDKRKRGWVDASKLGAMPNPTGTVYVNSDDYLGAGQAESIKQAMQNANAQFIYNYLTAYDFTPQAACGVLGNIMKECTMNPAKWQGVPEAAPDITKGYGLFQWTSATNYLRRAITLGMIDSQSIAAMNDYADTLGKEKALMLSQLEFMLAGCFAGFQWHKPGPANKHAPHEFTIQEYMESTLDAGTLAIVFHDHFERSGDYDDVFWTDDLTKYDPESSKRLSIRRDYANTFYANLVQA